MCRIVQWLHAQAAAQRDACAPGCGWHTFPEELTPFQYRAAIILDEVAEGIWLAPIDWTTAIWRPNTLAVDWSGSLASMAMPGLTRAVMLAHDAAVRIAIVPSQDKPALRLVFSDSASRLRYERHPTLKDAVGAHQQKYPATHPIHFTAA